MSPSQTGEGCVQGDQPFVRNLGGDREVGQFDPVAVAAVLFGSLAAGGVHQNSAHGFGGGREEVPAVLPADFVGRADESEVRLVNQGGGLKGLVGGFVCHPHSGEFPQFVVDQWEQVGGRVTTPGSGGVEEASQIGHLAEYIRNVGADNSKRGSAGLSRVTGRCSPVG